MNFTKIKNVAYNKMTKVFKDKKTCFETVADAQVYFSRDIKENDAAKEFGGMSWEEMREYTTEDNHLYEIIKEERPRYSYFDVDAPYQKIKGFFKDENKIEEELTGLLKAMIEDFKADNDIQEESDLVVLNASTKAKYSFHFIDRSIVFKNKEDCKLYHDKFIDHLYHTDTTILSTIIDKCVYDKDRNFRCINQTKFKKGAIPLKLTSAHTHSDTFITNVGNTDTHKIPKSWYKKKSVYIQPIKEVLEEDEDDEITTLIEHLSDTRFEDYTSWINTVWCLFACGVSPDVIHYESSARCPDKYNYESTSSQIKQYDHTRSKFSIETLKAWAKQDSGFEIERVKDRVRKEQPVKREDHFKFIDLLRKYNKRDFSMGSGLDEFTKDVSSCVSMCINSDTTFCMYSNDENQFDLTTKIPKLSFSVSQMETDAQGKSKETKSKYTLQQYMIDECLKFPLYTKMVFKPNDVGLGNNELNTWAGFKAQKVGDVDMDIVNVFLNHIKDVWANGNEEYYRYLLSWIAQVIKTPEKKTEVAIVLQGGQGSGKTLPNDILLQRVFGRNIGMSASGLGSLTQRFNGSTMGKVFCKVDELSVLDSDSHGACFDKMKSLITDSTIQIEKKGMEHIMIDNHSNFIMTTNHRHTIKVEGDDRRYACFEVSDKYKQDTDYFAKFMEVLDNDEAGNHIFTYFKDYPVEEMVNIRKIPMTDIKREMLESSKNTVQRFVENMDEEYESAFLYDWIGKDGERAISVGHFYEKYKEWCGLNGEKSWSSKAVGVGLNKLCKTKDKNRNNKEQKRYYQF